MFFLYTLSSIFGLIVIYNKSSYIFDVMIELAKPIAVTLFLSFNYSKAKLISYYKNAYNNNILVSNISDYCSYIIENILSNYYNYKLEPRQPIWLNQITMYNNNNKIDIIEQYNTNLLLPDGIAYYNHYKNTDKTKLLMLKNNGLYIYKHDSIKEYNNSITKLPNPFFSVTYLNVDTDETFELDLPTSIFIEGNEILSKVFLCRWFKYMFMPKDFVFNLNYKILLLDNSFNEEVILPSQYILLNNKTYTIKNI